MINETNLEKLYDVAIDNKELTTRQLKECDFNQYDITNLINNSVIERVRRGYYDFKDTESLFSYGKKLIKLKENEKAYKCFSKCYEINPNNTDIFFQLLLRSITNKDYNKTIELLDRLSNSDNEYYNIDSNIYIYLLNMITDISEKDRNFAKFIGYYDIKIPSNDTRYDDNKRYNSVRSLIIKRKLSLALKQLNNFVLERGNATVYDIILMALLRQVIKVEAQSREIITNYIINNEYEKVVSHLYEKGNKYKLSLFDNSILSLAKKYLDIRNNGIIPLVTVNDTDNIFEAINGNNFELALKICKNYNKENKIKDSNSIYVYILNDLINLVNALNDENVNRRQIQKDESNKRKLERKKHELEVIKNKEEDIDKSFIDKKYDELLDNHGIILLPTMKEERIDRILEIAKKYPNMNAAVIDDFGKQRVMLRYKPLIPDPIDVSEVLEDCKQFYMEHDYKKCIESNLKLMETLDEPSYKSYLKTGLSYLKLHQKSKAIDYITVANSICLKNNDKYEFSYLLLSLRGEIDQNERKRVFKTKEDFFNETNDNIDSFDEINNYICESGLDVTSACLELNLNKDQIDIINLIYAKRFFELGNEEKGSLFLNHVEKSKNKSTEVKKMISEIRKKMKFYKNRKSDDTKQLKLTLTPKK